MNSCPYDHAEMQSYGHDKCPYCRMMIVNDNTEKAKWEERLKPGSLSVYSEAMKRAGQPVEIRLSRDLGDPLWAVATEDDFWMDAFPTEVEARAFVSAMGWPLIGEEPQTENTQGDSDCQKRRFEEAVGSLDRYGIPHEGIINMLDALSDYIDDEAHGRGGYEAHFKIIQDELDALRSCSLMSDDNCVSPLVGRLVFAGDLEVNGEEISGCALDIDRPTLIAAKSLPMYERCVILTAAELRKMEAVIEAAKCKPKNNETRLQH